MRKILSPVIILPLLLGITVSFLMFLMIRRRGEENLPYTSSSAPRTSLPSGELINLMTNQDDYERLKKGKVLLVFLTTNCDACKREIPHLSDALPSLLSTMAVYGVCAEERSKVNAFIQENQIKFPVLLDKGGAVFTGLDITLFPAKVLIDDGRITKMWFGSSQNKAALINDVGEVKSQ